MAFTESEAGSATAVETNNFKQEISSPLQLTKEALRLDKRSFADIHRFVGGSKTTVEIALKTLVEKQIAERFDNGDEEFHWRLRDTKNKILAAIDECCCTLMQIKRHAEIPLSVDISKEIDEMLADQEINFLYNGATTAYFRFNKMPLGFYLAGGKVVQKFPDDDAAGKPTVAAPVTPAPAAIAEQNEIHTSDREMMDRTDEIISKSAKKADNGVSGAAFDDEARRDVADVLEKTGKTPAKTAGKIPVQRRKKAVAATPEPAKEKKNSTDDELIAEVKKLASEGVTAIEISAHFGKNKNWIYAKEKINAAFKEGLEIYKSAQAEAQKAAASAIVAELNEIFPEHAEDSAPQNAAPSPTSAAGENSAVSENNNSIHPLDELFPPLPSVTYFPEVPDDFENPAETSETKIDNQIDSEIPENKDLPAMIAGLGMIESVAAIQGELNPQTFFGRVFNQPVRAGYSITIELSENDFIRFDAIAIRDETTVQQLLLDKVLDTIKWDGDGRYDNFVDRSSDLFSDAQRHLSRTEFTFKRSDILDFLMNQIVKEGTEAQKAALADFLSKRLLETMAAEKRSEK